MTPPNVQRGLKSTVEVVNDLVAHWINPPEIFVIDDDDYVLEVFETSIRKLGCTPFVARDGLEAEKIYRDKMRTPFKDDGSSQHPFDLVFLDLKLPGMRGASVLKNIRSLWRLQPIVIISGVIDFSRDPEIVDYGPVSLMTKPISLTNIRDCILMHNIRMKKVSGLD